MSKNSDRGNASDSSPRNDDTHRTQATQRHYEPDGRGELTTAIVFALADAEGVAPSELRSPPLYECVDVPAIEDAFFGPDVSGGGQQGVGTVEFGYTDYRVEVRSDGWIRVYERTETPQP